LRLAFVPGHGHDRFGLSLEEAFRRRTIHQKDEKGEKMIVKEFDFYPFELTDVWGETWMNRIYIEFRVPIRIKRWTTFGFIGFVKDIFEAKRKEVEIIEVTKDGSYIYITFAIENTWLVKRRSFDYINFSSIDDSNVEYAPIH
jgi:hypothetical protein